MIVSISVYIFYSYLWSPLQVTIKTVEEENRSLADKISMQQNLLQQEKPLPGDKAPNELESLWHQVPDTPCIPEAIACLEGAAEKSGVVIQAINYQRSPAAGRTQESTTPGSWESEDLKVRVRGEYQHIKDFIAQMESETRIYILSSSRLQTQIRTSAPTEGGAWDPVSYGSYNPTQIIAEIKIKIIYDHIPMPGGEGEIGVITPGSSNPFDY